jgi:hypothetical protein
LPYKFSKEKSMIVELGESQPSMKIFFIKDYITYQTNGQLVNFLKVWVEENRNFRDLRNFLTKITEKWPYCNLLNFWTLLLGLWCHIPYFVLTKTLRIIYTVVTTPWTIYGQPPHTPSLLRLLGSLGVTSIL